MENDNLDVKFGGKSIEEVSVYVAEKVLFQIEDKKSKEITRSEYLEAIVQANRALRGLKDTPKAASDFVGTYS